MTKPPPLSTTHSLDDDYTVTLDYSEVYILNKTLSANFRGPFKTHFLKVTSISSLSIDGLYLYFNGDLSLAELLKDPVILLR